MQFTEINNTALAEKYFTFTHKSGLNIIVSPKPHFSKTYAIFATKYGSIDNCFIDNDGNQICVPAGIAHFLEHKLFESEKGNAFERYAQTGASANAFTSFDKTAYLFSSTDNFEQSLEILLDFVQNPYFSKESVEKEQGIIGQEISMYNDNADWRLLFNCLGGIYHNHPVKIDIAGTAETIADITPELLYKCYKNFYNLSQMVLCVCGDITPKQIYEIADKNIKIKETCNVKRIYDDEPVTVATKRAEQKLSVSKPLFMIGIKDNIKELNGNNYVKRKVQTDILLTLLAGKSSNLYSLLYSEALINNNFDIEYYASESFAVSLISGESDDPDKLYKIFFENAENIKKNGINKNDFLRIKKSLYGKTIKRFNNSEHIANDLVTCDFINTTVFNFIKEYEKVTYEDITVRLNDYIKEENAVLSVILPE